jgi:hypothetical protein
MGSFASFFLALPSLFLLSFDSTLLLTHVQLGMIAVGSEKYGNDEKLQQNTGPIKPLYETQLQSTKNAETDAAVKAAAVAWYIRMEADEVATFARSRKRHVLSVCKDAQ